MQEDEVEIFEIEPAAVEKPAELGPASKQITVSVRSEVTVSYMKRRILALKPEV